jgi:hypothetical protein
MRGERRTRVGRGHSVHLSDAGSESSELDPSGALSGKLMRIVKCCRSVGRVDFCEQVVRTIKKRGIYRKVSWRILMLDTSCDTLH